MGISGLLPALKAVQRPAVLGDYNGKRAAIDTYCWLHRAAYSCSRELCQGVPTRRHIDYVLNRIGLLKRNGVTPVMIFDGGRLPSKADEEKSREKSRNEQREKALAHLRAGNQSAANECFQRAVDITPAVAATVIQALKEEGVECIVAPYEADAQMAYLSRIEYVDLIITEDSDLLAYGAHTILFKLDKLGAGVEIRYQDIMMKDVSFVGFTRDQFLEMCILSGCDYLPSVSGIGVKKAHGYIRRLKTYTKVFST